jgi:hypothetical protein
MENSSVEASLEKSFSAGYILFFRGEYGRDFDWDK